MVDLFGSGLAGWDRDNLPGTKNPLTYYYDINEADNFEQLFGHTAIGKDPTPLHNSCMILSLDFSIVDPSGGIEDIRHRFYQICNISLQSIVWRYRKYFKEPIDIDTLGSGK